jgi:hypothetical protein
MSIGLNLGSLAKVIKCAGNDDVITLKANDKADVLGLLFESPSKFILKKKYFLNFKFWTCETQK